MIPRGKTEKNMTFGMEDLGGLLYTRYYERNEVFRARQLTSLKIQLLPATNKLPIHCLDT